MTGNITTQARPYAVAAFEYAAAHQGIPAWENMLQAAAVVTKSKEVTRFLTNPAFTTAQHAELYCSVLAAVLDPEKTNFIKLLAENYRLSALPEIASLFKDYRADSEKTVDVEVISAVALDERYQQNLVQALTKRLQRKVKLACRIDTAILGGAIIRAGDNVIDGSVRGKLNRLVEFISGIS